MVMYLCSRFRIFNRSILEQYVSIDPHLLQSCFCVAQDNLYLIVRKIHPSFENLAIINAPNLQAFFMDIHHNTSFRSILEDNYISSTSKARICFCSNKGVRLWLIVRSSICSFRIAQFTFISMVHFCFGLIQSSTSNLFACDCGYGLDASSTCLTCFSFGGERIATHDAIKDVMYASIQENGHVAWEEWWYPLMSGTSLQVDFYMTHEDQIFVIDVVVIDPTWKMMATSVIS